MFFGFAEQDSPSLAWRSSESDSKVIKVSFSIKAYGYNYLQSYIACGKCHSAAKMRSVASEFYKKPL